MNTDKLFSRFYNKFNKVVSTHAPFKSVSKRMQSKTDLQIMYYQGYKEINQN